MKNTENVVLIVIRFKINISKTTSHKTILDALKFDIIKTNQTINAKCTHTKRKLVMLHIFKTMASNSRIAF